MASLLKFILVIALLFGAFIGWCVIREQTALSDLKTDLKKLASDIHPELENEAEIKKKVLKAVKSRQFKTAEKYIEISSKPTDLTEHGGANPSEVNYLNSIRVKIKGDFKPIFNSAQTLEVTKVVQMGYAYEPKIQLQTDAEREAAARPSAPPPPRAKQEGGNPFSRAKQRARDAVR